MVSNTVAPFVDLNSEPGASSWLLALQLQDQGFHLTKQEFWNALHLRYDWNLLNTPSHCVCGANFSTDHAICRHGGLTFVRHNDLFDITAELLSEVCNDVAIEPPLQSLSGEVITPQSANQQDDARTDIHARGFWGRRQCAFFDIRLGCFIQMHRATAILLFHLCINVMSNRRRGSMVIVSVRWSWHLSLLQFFQQPEVWARKQSLFIAV